MDVQRIDGMNANAQREAYYDWKMGQSKLDW
jgi:hypothetical protein